MELREALNDLEIAFVQLDFAIRLLSYCELEKIKPADFDVDHIVRLPEGNLHYRSGQFSKPGDLNRAASVSVLLAFSATAILLDRAFEVAGHRPNPRAEDNAGKLRTLVYMVRCAHAHGIADPRWEVRGDYRRTLELNVEGNNISLDMTNLQGQPLHIQQIGGYTTWYAIRRAARVILLP